MNAMKVILAILIGLGISCVPALVALAWSAVVPPNRAMQRAIEEADAARARRQK